MRLTAIDLFSGAGGLSHGLRAAGFDVVLAVDSWQLAVDTYAKNFGHTVISSDVASLRGDELLELAGLTGQTVDLLAGGPPCQGFSIQRIGNDADARNDLVLEFARLVDEVRPKTFLMENVLGLLGKRGHLVLDQVLRRFADAGYDTMVHRVNAADYGVPQNRRRVVVMGRRPDIREIDIPNSRSLDDRPTVWDAIGDLPRPAPPGGIGDDPLHIESRLSALNRQRLELIPPGGGFEDLPVALRVDCHKGGAGAIGQRGVYGRLDADTPAGTITARFDSFTRGRFAHPFEHRNITLREGARLQTFPDGHVFLGNREEIAAQIGNAIPPIMAAELASVIARAIQASCNQTVVPPITRRV